MKIVIISLLLIVSLSSTFAANEDSLKSNITENNQTVVLFHGFARSSSAMWLLKQRLEDAGFNVESIAYKSIRQAPEEIVLDISQKIDHCCKHLKSRVHFVGHSLGGLLIRAYLQDNQLNNLGRVVLMGTPNQGTQVADFLQGKWLGKVAGDTALSLGTADSSFPNSLAKPYYPVGVIAGIKEKGLNDKILPGDDDGLVAVEATKLEGMKDFVLIETSHSRMRYNQDVANQTIAFLKSGQFNKK